MPTKINPPPTPASTPMLYDPKLTPGQQRVLTAETPRLFRLLGRRDPAAMSAVLVLLEDLTSEASAVDADLAAEAARRHAAEAARPRPATLLSKRGQR
jgi:hypothetical protein